MSIVEGVINCNTNTSPDRDEYYTPSMALDYLEFLPKKLTVWEPCSSPYDTLAKRMRTRWPDWTVHATDISRGEDFLTYEPAFEFDMIITNPPYRNKIAFIRRALSFGKPVIFLLSTVTVESNPLKRESVGQKLTIIAPHTKINFIPKRLYLLDPDREKFLLRETQSMFHSSWFTWHLDVPDMPGCTVFRST